MSTVLSFYIGRNFLACFISVFAVFLSLIYLFDIIELLRLARTRDEVGIGLVLKMSLLKLPFLGQQAFPFAVLFGSMIAFLRMTRNHELVVARASGISAWHFLLPVLGLALILGTLQITVLNPLASVLKSKFDRLNAIHIKGQTNLLALSPNGLWLRETNKQNQSVIHSTTLNLSKNSIKLKDVTIFSYQGSNKYRQRLSAIKAELEDGFWLLSDVWIHERDKELPMHKKEHWLPTNITLNNLHDSFAPPETLSFWSLPDFISNLDKAGFSAVRHRLYWHSLLATPLLLLAMVLIAATFTLKQSPRAKTSIMIIGGILTGFFLFFFLDVVSALGLRESIPVILAAWAPSGISALLGLAMVFHLEDG